MIKSLVFLSVVAMAAANSYRRDNWGNSGYGGNDGGYGGNGGYGKDDYSQPIPYSFGYDVKDDHGLELSREEQGDGHGSVKGSYTLQGEHGTKRRVEYVADKNGFRAVVKTNEPGTAKSNPADVEMLADPMIVDSGYGRSSYGKQDNSYGRQNSYRQDNNNGYGRQSNNYW